MCWLLAYMSVSIYRSLCDAGPYLDGESVFNILEDYQVGNTAGVPTIYLGLLDYMAANNKKLHYLTSLVCGGAACPPKIFDAFDRCACFAQPACFAHPAFRSRGSCYDAQ